MTRLDKLPEALRHLRESRGLTLSRAARAAGIEPEQMAAWEQDHVRLTLEDLALLADAYALDLGELDDALVLAGARIRPRALERIDPRRLARQLLGVGERRAPVDPVELELGRLLDAAFGLAQRFRERSGAPPAPLTATAHDGADEEGSAAAEGEEYALSEAAQDNPRSYTNPDGQAALPEQDTDAFPCE